MWEILGAVANGLGNIFSNQEGKGAAEDAGHLEVDVGHVRTVATLLREHLEVRLREVKPSFEAAALELRGALNLA